MHVSPFMAMDLDYGFALTQPDANLVAHMTTSARGPSAEGPFFDATLTLEHQPWTPKGLRRSLLRHPWMTAKVILAIHWQALLLLIKRVPVFTHPARVRPPAEEAPKQS